MLSTTEQTKDNSNNISKSVDAKIFDLESAQPNVVNLTPNGVPPKEIAQSPNGTEFVGKFLDSGVTKLRKMVVYDNRVFHQTFEELT